MTLPQSALLDRILRGVARRYRLPEMPALRSPMHEADPATALAFAIERARAAVARAETPDPVLRQIFIDALARMIHDAMREDHGDPAIQAMVLRHRAAHVREYASLCAHAERDRRLMHATVKAIAHPARQRVVPTAQRDALARLEASMAAPCWSAFDRHLREMLAIPEVAREPHVERHLARLVDSAALRRLLRIETLASDEQVRRYEALWVRHGPRSGSSAALAQGLASQQRGAAAEALATRALSALAERLNEGPNEGPSQRPSERPSEGLDERSNEADAESAAYRVVTSMRVPSSIPASHERAKSEWDVVLLRRAPPSADQQTALWDVCLLVEAKASVDAATTDFARLVRGLRLLAHAAADHAYAFETGQGVVHVRGASLCALPTDGADLRHAVLYCCNAPVEPVARTLGAASRMQLLSAQASLQFASALAGNHAANQAANPCTLEPVWQQLLEAPQWRALLNQYATLRQVRELIVHPDDLLAAIDAQPRD